MKTFREFQKLEDAVAILYGDWGGSVYATIPLSYLPDTVTPKDIKDLAVKLEMEFWDCNIELDDPDGGAMVNYMIKSPGTPILGGMGGGLVVDGIWTHPYFGEKCREMVNSFVNRV